MLNFINKRICLFFSIINIICIGFGLMYGIFNFIEFCIYRNSDSLIFAYINLFIVLILIIAFVIKNFLKMTVIYYFIISTVFYLFVTLILIYDSFYPIHTFLVVVISVSLIRLIDLHTKIKNAVIISYLSIYFFLVFIFLLIGSEGIFFSKIRLIDFFTIVFAVLIGVISIILHEKKIEIELKKVYGQKDIFFTDIIHGTKTPLTIIRNAIEECIKNNKHIQELSVLKQNIDKLCRDMVNFLDVHKLDRGQIFYNHNQIIDFSELLKKKINDFKKIAQKKRIIINSKIEDSLNIEADPYAVDRIVNNILDNSIKYSNDNGKIDILLSSNNEKINFKVNDNGIGIEEDKQRFIFLPYHQVSRKKRNIQGIGMGLYIVNKIVNELKGNICVESKVNQGTTFSVSFPRYILNEKNKIIDNNKYSKPIDNISTLKLIDTEYKEYKDTIFVVEKSIDLLAYMQMYMQGKYNFFYALNGREGLNKLQCIPKPHIIISDIMMDEIDGYEFYDKLKNNKKYQDISCIFLTDKSSDEDRLKGLSIGAIDYISKPFKMEELLAKVNSILQIIKAQKEASIIEMEQKLLKVLRQDNPEKDFELNFDKYCNKYNISIQEKNVIRNLIENKTNKEIAIDLFISEGTVKCHLNHIFEKFNVKNRRELISLFK